MEGHEVGMVYEMLSQLRKGAPYLIMQATMRAPTLIAWQMTEPAQQSSCKQILGLQGCTSR